MSDYLRTTWEQRIGLLALGPLILLFALVWFSRKENR